MKKISILSLPFLALAVGLLFSTSNTQAQSKAEITKMITANNKNFVKYYNDGDIDKLVTLYDKEACVLTAGCGTVAIKNYYTNSLLTGYKFVEITMQDLSISQNIAVEKGTWVIEFPGRQKMHGKYMTEWQLIDGRWLIKNDIANTESVTP